MWANKQKTTELPLPIKENESSKGLKRNFVLSKEGSRKTVSKRAVVMAQKAGINALHVGAPRPIQQSLALSTVPGVFHL